MKRLLILLASLIFVVQATYAKQFSAAQTTEIQGVVQKYLLAHPEILIQMSKELQQKQYANMQQQALSAIKTNSKLLFAANGTQVAGNPKGKVTLVEFFDYQCVHCAHVFTSGTIKNLIKTNPQLRVIYKEFPIFGAQSTYAADAAMAAALQGKYLAMHAAIFKTGKIEGKLKKADVDGAAKSIGLDMKKYHSDMNSNKSFKEHIAETMQLAQTLGIRGTPAFIVAPTPGIGSKSGKTTFVPGLVEQAQLQQAVLAAK
jgi:protein-disulfide isomerase